MLRALEDYYQAHCDGTWEHFYGFTLETCDNPGWMLNIKDPCLFEIMLSLIDAKNVSDTVDIQVRNSELSEIVLFSHQVHDLSEFVVQVVNIATDGKQATGDCREKR